MSDIKLLQTSALSTDRVEELLKMAKKPNSMVEGDIFPHLYGIFGRKFAEAITPVFNTIISTRSWPDPWKVEMVTVIPKVHKPPTLAQCRNISCTNFLLKVMETELLYRLRCEIVPDEVQYGGMKRMGVEHLLVEVWERILGGLEVPGVGVSLLGIDYEKAFNRMDHNVCLQQLARLGASQVSIDLVCRQSTRIDSGMFPILCDHAAAGKKLGVP